jgi:hypothetical protein
MNDFKIFKPRHKGKPQTDLIMHLILLHHLLSIYISCMIFGYFLYSIKEKKYAEFNTVTETCSLATELLTTAYHPQVMTY